MNDRDNNLLREFSYRYNASISEGRQQVSLPLNVRGMYDSPNMQYANSIHYSTIPAFAVTIGEVQLLEIIEKLTEYDALMRDPETKRIVMEAKFMNRLRTGI